MSRRVVAYVAASGLTLGAAVWAAWWLFAGRLTAALLPMAVVGIGAELIRRAAPRVPARRWAAGPARPAVRAELTPAETARALADLLDRAGCLRLEIVRGPGGRLGGYCVTAGPDGRPAGAFHIGQVLDTPGENRAPIEPGA